MSRPSRIFGRRAAGPARRTSHVGLRAALCGAIWLLAPAAGAQADFADQKDRLVAAIEAAGCIVHDGNEAAILRAAKLTPVQGSVVVSFLMQTGEAEPFGDDLRLKTGACK
jgi:hypothetical protein